MKFITFTLEVSNLEGAYNRNRIIYINTPAKELDESCNVCDRQDIPLLLSDDSDGEYSGTAICKDCIDKAFNLYESN